MMKWIQLLLLLIMLVAPGCCRTPQQPLPTGSIPLTNGYGTPVQTVPQVATTTAAPVVKKTTTKRRTTVRKTSTAKPAVKKTTQRRTVRRTAARRTTRAATTSQTATMPAIPLPLEDVSRTPERLQ